ncbi:hypothetical protein QBC39DRAFT_102942 [Podospora conica]|nr:hypothetical protein QBC39DRAFT_102942 [Schizothecium conicum]
MQPYLLSLPLSLCHLEMGHHALVHCCTVACIGWHVKCRRRNPEFCSPLLQRFTFFVHTLDDILINPAKRDHDPSSRYRSCSTEAWCQELDR